MCFVLQEEGKLSYVIFLKALKLALAQPLNAHPIFDITLVSSPLPCSFAVDPLRMLLPFVWVVWFALQLHTVSERVYLEAGRILAAVPRGFIVLVPVQSQPLAGGIHFLERAVKGVTCPRVRRCLGKQPESRL